MAASAQVRVLNLKMRPRFWIPSVRKDNGEFKDRYNTPHPLFEVTVEISRNGASVFKETFKRGEGAHQSKQNVNEISLDPFIADLKQKNQAGDTTAAPTAGAFKLVLTPGEKQLSFGAASPDSGFALGPPIVGHDFETEYRPLDLEIELDASFQVSKAKVTSGREASRGPNGEVFVKAVKDGQLLDVDWRFDWLRRIRTKVRPLTASRAGAAVDVVVLHQTGNDTGTGFPATFVTLDEFVRENKKLGTHYVVDVDGHIIKLGDEEEFMNHTGKAAWRGVGKVAERSIGIEHIHNKSQNGVFPDAQMAASVDLVTRLVNEHAVKPFNIVGHADVKCIAEVDINGSPPEKPPPPLAVQNDLRARLANGGFVLNPSDRKNCPGIKFEWQRYENAGIALTPVPASAGTPNYQFFVTNPTGQLKVGSNDPAVIELQNDLIQIGWPLSDSHPKPSFDSIVQIVVLRFQARFLSHLGLGSPNGIVDAETGLVIKRVRAALVALGAPAVT